MDEKGRFKNQRGFDPETAHGFRTREEKKHGKMPADDERALGYGKRDNKKGPKKGRNAQEEIPLSKRRSREDRKGDEAE
jgi:hypothetical protein